MIKIGMMIGDRYEILAKKSEPAVCQMSIKQNVTS